MVVSISEAELAKEWTRVVDDLDAQNTLKIVDAEQALQQALKMR